MWLVEANEMSEFLSYRVERWFFLLAGVEFLMSWFILSLQKFPSHQPHCIKFSLSLFS